MTRLWKDNSKNFLSKIIQINVKITKKNVKSNYQIFRNYAKIVNAYEVLKDPETRKVYNKRGKKGVEEF